MTILLVGDPALTRMMKAVLSREAREKTLPIDGDRDIHVAATVGEVKDRMRERQKPYDMLIVDIMNGHDLKNPRAQGFDAIEASKEFPTESCGETKIILIASHFDIETLNRAHAAGVTARLQKGFTYRQLIEAINFCLTGRTLGQHEQIPR